MKIREFGPRGGRVSLVHPLGIRHCFYQRWNIKKSTQWRIQGELPRHTPHYGPKLSRFHSVLGEIWQYRMLAPPPRGLAPLLQGIVDPSLVLIIVQCISVEKLKGKYTRKFQKSVPMCRFIKTPRTYTWFHFRTPKWCLMSSTVNILHFWMITNEYVLFRRFLIHQNTSCSS